MGNKGREMIHTLAHWFDLNKRKATAQCDKDGNLWYGLKCLGCGQVTDKRFKTPYDLRMDKMLTLAGANLMKNNIIRGIQNNAEYTPDVVRFKRQTDYKSNA